MRKEVLLPAHVAAGCRRYRQDLDTQVSVHLVGAGSTGWQLLVPVLFDDHDVHSTFVSQCFHPNGFFRPSQDEINGHGADTKMTKMHLS